MKTEQPPYTVVLSLTTLIFVIILISSTAMASPSTGPYAYITNFDTNNVTVIDTTNNTVIAAVDVGNNPFGVAVNPDGTKVYVTNSGSNTVSIIDTANNNVTAIVPVGNGPYGIAVNPAGTKVYVTARDSNNISVIDTATNNVVATINELSGPLGVAVSPDGKKLYEVNGGNNTISIIDTVTDSITAIAKVGNNPFGVTVSPDGKKVYVTNQGSNNVSVIDTATNNIIATLNVGRLPEVVAVSPDGTKGFVTNYDSSNISVIDIANDTVINTLNEGMSPNGIAVDPSGKNIYVTNTISNSVSVIDIVTNSIIKTISVGGNPTASGQFIGPLQVQPVLPVSNFSSNVSKGNAPLTVQFTDLSTKATAWNWYFGDGANSQVQNPMHTYSTAGNYKVTLTISNVSGTDSKSSYITVSSSGSAPVAAFSASPTSGNAPLNVSFTDESTGSPTSWKWYFDDGTNSTNQNPVHTFSKEGLYTVTLYASNAGGSNSVAKSNYITVSNGVTVPVAAFSASPTSGSAPLNVSFTDESTGSPTSWKWYFGDGTNSTDQNPVHTFSKAGKYAVTLTASNAGGRSSIAKSSCIIVSNGVSIPVAAFSASPISGSAPLNVSFTDESTGSPTSWKWYFDDGTNSTDQNPVHTFSKEGLYTVTLYASNAGGSNSAAKSNYITVSSSGSAPVAAFSASPTSGSAPLNVSFTDASTGSPTRWKWFFGDGTNSTDQNPMHTFSNPGLYTVTLTASNSKGSSSVTKSKFIYIPSSLDAPVAAFTASTISGRAPLKVSFNASSTSSPTSWQWYFGEYGTNTTDQNPVHTYNNPGLYTVILTVKNAGGRIAVTKPNYIYVTNDINAPVAAFSASPTSGSAPLNVSFTDESTGSPTNWKWYFGDGTNSTDQNPVHTFSKEGLYTVTLYASNAGGSSSIAKSNNITVSNGVAAPVAAFSASPISGSAPLNVSFTDESTGSPTSWKWYFDDGTNSTDQNPVHTFNKAGKYTVTLYVSNAGGSNSAAKSNYIAVSSSGSAPAAAFSASPTSGSAPLNVSFTDSSTGSPTSWKWYFGDGTNSTDQNPAHTFSKEGLYTVTLSVNNARGSSSVAKSNYIIVSSSITAPVAAFTASPISGSAPLNVSFTDASTGSPTSWKWYFDDGTNSTDQNPVHTFSKAGLYTVTLYASNVGGSNSVAKSNYIAVSSSGNDPVAAFSASPTSGNAPLNVSFTDESTGSPTSWKWYFGDGTNSTDQSPMHTFSKAGTYNVGLTVTNPGGSSAITISKYITVK